MLASTLITLVENNTKFSNFTVKSDVSVQREHCDVVNALELVVEGEAPPDDDELLMPRNVVQSEVDFTKSNVSAKNVRI